jgi:hypothetical protein
LLINKQQQHLAMVSRTYHDRYRTLFGEDMPHHVVNQVHQMMQRGMPHQAVMMTLEQMYLNRPPRRELRAATAQVNNKPTPSPASTIAWHILATRASVADAARTLLVPWLQAEQNSVVADIMLLDDENKQEEDAQTKDHHQDHHHRPWVAIVDTDDGVCMREFFQTVCPLLNNESCAYATHGLCVDRGTLTPCVPQATPPPRQPLSVPVVPVVPVQVLLSQGGIRVMPLALWIAARTAAPHDVPLFKPQDLQAYADVFDSNALCRLGCTLYAVNQESCPLPALYVAPSLTRFKRVLLLLMHRRTFHLWNI